MRYPKKIFFIGSLIALCLSCVEPFNIHSISFEKAIVVEGRITNEQKAHYVRLSYTRPIGEEEKAPLSSATVWVEGADGSKIEFAETEPGYYQSCEEIAGVAGASYQLLFTTSEGRQYQSSKQELIASPSIDSIYDVYTEQSGKGSSKLEKGIQFFVDTHDETNEARHFRYEWEETYEVRAQYPSYYEYLTNPDTVVARTQDVSPCYVSNKSVAINVGTTANLTKSRLSEVPIRFITSETDHLRFAYSILVRQYVVSAEAYGFYRRILENNNDNGELFDKQLGVVAGNVTSVTDPDETVLGFFEVSGVSEKRAFFRFRDLDTRFPLPNEQYPCLERHSIFTTDSLAYYVRGKGYGIISAGYNTTPYDPGFRATLAPSYCTDCRFRGPAVKPDFWIY